MDKPNVLEMSVGEFLEQFLADGVRKREVYFSQEDFDIPLPNGRTLRLSADFVSTAKLHNRAEV